MRVLLVEDFSGFKRQFESVFGSVDLYLSFEEMKADGDLQFGWDYAFVDFELGSSEATGFSVLNLLRHRSPETKVILFTALDENRTLHALAAFHWFTVWGITTKRGCTDEALIALRDGGVNPTPRRWLEVFRNEAWRIDTLFPDHQSLARWLIWSDYLGTANAIALAFDYLGGKNEIGVFKKKIVDAVKGIEPITDMVKGESPSVGGLSPTLQSVLKLKMGHSDPDARAASATVSFANDNAMFFNCPELEGILKVREPWKNLDDHRRERVSTVSRRGPKATRRLGGV
ncbi:hypothetical protein [Prescottella equi]|uniref:hypothetical protein n=1 Tax=Rhodococcus hoagii TaxID=43767 RepID=UPI001C73E7BE|nr:hypothetical protein [Prescottella equi]BCN51604.1 hypothetical protein RE9416_49050 [Prescottella equi]BCN56625.1 hypothetical protein RE9425_50150 [Prescottella equi]BCN61539.1 hypothetical protein RE9427_49090 [Prescottella equi]BCN86342.1 hypothetical protein RE0356_49830 [Prescottella equi]